MLRIYGDVQDHRPWVIVPSRQIIETIPPLTVYKPPVRREGIVIGAIQSYSILSLLVKHDDIGNPVLPDWNEFDIQYPEQRNRVDAFSPAKRS